jgi:hypothetical protein
LQLWTLDKDALTFRNAFLLIFFFFLAHSCDLQVFGSAEMLDNLSFDRTIQVVQMNKINTITILEKYKMFPKHKAKMNIPFCKMISMHVVRLALKIDVLKME